MIPLLIGARVGDTRDATRATEPGVEGAAPAIAHVTSFPVIPTAIPCWRPSGTAFQMPVDLLEGEHGAIRVRGRPPWIGRLSSPDGAEEGDVAYLPRLSLAPTAPPLTMGRRGRQDLVPSRDESQEPISSGDDDETNYIEETTSKPSKSESEDDDDADSKSGRGEEAETGSGSGSGKDDDDSESHSSDDSDVDDDSASEFPLWKRTKRASLA
ncbi:nucleolar transcription factor 1-like [Camellia sinensis]|uniref:nucleolar transcription factor 1-like n=1 Tax=Camellia sinensis TaxID=4442 RepID=UPI0010362756|nr:nucleolar transcription factor 1-like [Camellia sinensis]